MLKKHTNKNHMNFFLALTCFAIACFVRHFKFQISFYNTTLFALNYDYGFISRGLLGTFWNFLDDILPINLTNYTSIYNFTGLCTILYFACLFWFYKICMDKCSIEHKQNMMHLIVFLSIFAFPMFIGKAMFGRLDLYLFIFMILSMILILIEKSEWLIIPIGIICICIHQGFVFTNANTILVLLLYKILFGNQKKRAKYIVILTTFFITISILFIYFEFFSHVNGEMIVEEVIASAKALSESGKDYNKSIINHEILGLDVFQDEMRLHKYNMQDLPVFILLFFPYIYYGFRFFIRLIKDNNLCVSRRFIYLTFLLGGATMIPQFLLKVDYGRYMFHLIFYYVSLLMCSLAMKDVKISEDLESLKVELKNIMPMTAVWYLYPLLLTPFRDVTISSQIHSFAETLFTELTFYLQP